MVYPSLQKHLCIGGVYVKLLLEGSDPAAVDKLANPKEFFNAAYHTLLCCPPDEEEEGLGGAAASSRGAAAAGGGAGGKGAGARATQQLCVQAMAAAYSAHAGVIGPFEGVAHLLRLMDQTTRRSLRHGLLLLVQALVMPKAAGPPAAISATAAAFASAVTGRGGNITTLPNIAAGKAAGGSSSAGGGPGGGGRASSAGGVGGGLTAQQMQALRAARANGYALQDAGGLELLVDVVAGAHECTERRAAAVGGGGQVVGAGHLLTSISHEQVREQQPLSGVSSSRAFELVPM